MKIIRSDKLHLVTDAISREALCNTLSLYRRLVRDLMTVINTHWDTMGGLTGTDIVKAVEGMIHPTNKRPLVKYRYFSQRYYKFPSYLRRVAIMDAAGQVRSFHTRFNQWLDGERKHPHAKPPKLICATSTYPSLYRGQCIKFSERGDTVAIKVFWQNDWLWMTFRLRGVRRFAKNGTALSPLLTVSRKQWSLSLPHEITITLPKVDADTLKVLSIDVGINTAATGAVLDALGTVSHREFLRRDDNDSAYRLMERIRRAARKQTRHGSRLQNGFCGQDHRRLRQRASNEAQQLSRRIVNLAKHHHCQAVVVEALKGWRPTAGRKGSSLKARFHRWFHRLLVNLVEQKAQAEGIRFVTVYAGHTSKLAFDGSGKVTRDKDNASLCTFTTGKRYNADLNAAYNIGARGIVRLLNSSRRKSSGDGSQQKSGNIPGNPVTLSTLWANAA